MDVVRYAGVWNAFCGCDEAKIAATSFSSWMLRLRRTPVRGCAQRVMEQLLRGWRYLCPYLSVRASEWWGLVKGGSTLAQVYELGNGSLWRG